MKYPPWQTRKDPSVHQTCIKDMGDWHVGASVSVTESQVLLLSTHLLPKN
jgi:hypothetical protein